MADFWWLLNYLCGLLFFWIEDSVSDTLILSENLVDHELMIIVCIKELNLRLCIWIKMRSVIIAIFNFLYWFDNFTNVYCSRICLFFQIDHKILKFIAQIA